MEPFGMGKIYQARDGWLLIWRKDGQQNRATLSEDGLRHFQVSGDIDERPALVGR